MLESNKESLKLDAMKRVVGVSLRDSHVFFLNMCVCLLSGVQFTICDKKGG